MPSTSKLSTKMQKLLFSTSRTTGPTFKNPSCLVSLSKTSEVFSSETHKINNCLFLFSIYNYFPNFNYFLGFFMIVNIYILCNVEIIASQSLTYIQTVHLGLFNLNFLR